MGKHILPLIGVVMFKQKDIRSKHIKCLTKDYEILVRHRFAFGVGALGGGGVRFLTIVVGLNRKCRTSHIASSTGCGEHS